MLNEYFKEMVDGIFRWDGTSIVCRRWIMAFWFPLDQPTMQSLREMRARYDGQAQDQQNGGEKAKRYRFIGINTGEALIGNIGAQGKRWIIRSSAAMSILRQGWKN